MSSSSLNSALASLDRSLVHDFHKIPHIDGHFKNIAPIFNPENSEYDQALLLLALPAVIVGSLIFLGLITYYIARCACAKATPPPITKPPVCVVCWAVILVILSLIMGILCIMGSIRTTNGLNLVDQDLSSLGTFDSGAIAGFGLLQYFSAEGGQNVSTMQAKFGTGAPTNIQEAYLSLQTSFDEISSESSAQVISIEESPFNFNAVVHDINEFNSWREIITLVVFGFFTVVALIAFLSIVCKNDILGLIVCAFGVILIFLAWFLCGVHLSAAVAIADLCAQPNASVSAIVQSWNDKHADSRTALSQSDVNYYLYCDGETPYAPDFDKFSQALLNVHNSSNVLRAYYAGQPEPLYYLDACDVSAANTQLALTQTEETVNCTLTSASFFNALHNACGAPMDSTVLIFICSAFFGLFFLIAQCLFNTLTAYYQKDSKRFWLRGVDPKTQMALLHVEGMPDEPAADESEPPGMYYRRQQDAMDTINGTHTRPVSSTSQRRYVPLPEEDSYRPPTLPEQSQKQQQQQSQEQEQYEQRQGHQQARMQQQQPHYESIYYEPNRNTLASAPPSSSSTYDTHTRAPAPTPSFSADPAAPYATPGQNPFTDPAAPYTAPRQNPFTSYPSSSTTTYNTNTSYS